jgi:hypothetical protein
MLKKKTTMDDADRVSASEEEASTRLSIEYSADILSSLKVFFWGFRLDHTRNRNLPKYEFRLRLRSNTQ